MPDSNRPATLTLRASPSSAAPHRRTEKPFPPRQAQSEGSASEAVCDERAQRTLRSEALLQGHSHVLIAHNGETYQLRATRLGKLILTK